MKTLVPLAVPIVEDAPDFESLRLRVDGAGTRLGAAITELTAFMFLSEVAAAFGGAIVPKADDGGRELSFRFSGRAASAAAARKAFGGMVGWGATFGDAARDLSAKIRHVVAGRIADAD